MFSLKEYRPQSLFLVIFYEHFYRLFFQIDDLYHFYLERKQFLIQKTEYENLERLNGELKGNLVVKEAQILDLSGQIAEVKQSLSATSIKNKSLKSQLEEVKKIEPMLEVRKNYIRVLEEKLRHLDELCTNLNEENCKLKYGINRLENFRFHSFLASMGKTTNLLQSQY